MPAPSTLFSWATSGSAVVVNPSSGLQSVGYITGNKPGAGNFNAVLKNIFDWLTFFRDGGLSAVIEFADVAAAKAYTDFISNQFYLIPGYGLYKWDAASTEAGTDEEVIDPTVGGAGRLVLTIPDADYVSTIVNFSLGDIYDIIDNL
jgi:hypothetical protein